MTEATENNWVSDILSFQIFVPGLLVQTKFNVYNFPYIA